MSPKQGAVKGTVLTRRKGKRGMMLYIDDSVYEAIRLEAEKKSPPINVGPMAAEILRRYFDEQTDTKIA